MDHTIETLFQFNESPITGKIANLSFDVCAGRIFFLGFVPWVGFELAQSKRDFLLFPIDPEHNRFDFLVRLKDVGRLGNSFGPGKFGDVHQTFDPGFEFNERPVRHQIDHFAFDLCANRIFRFDAVPRIGQFLFQAKADPFLFAVDVEDDYVDVLTDLENLGGVTDTAPAHIGNVEQTIDTVQIDEGAEIGDILDRALANIARGHFGEQLLTAFGPFLFDQFAAGKDDILPFLIDLNNFEIVGIANVLGKVLGGADVDLRGGQ